MKIIIFKFFTNFSLACSSGKNHSTQIVEQEVAAFTGKFPVGPVTKDLLILAWSEEPVKEPPANHTDVNQVLREKESFYKVDLPITIASREGEVDLVLPKSRGVANPLENRLLPTAKVLHYLQENSLHSWTNPIALVAVSGAAKTSTTMEVASQHYCMYVEASLTQPNYGAPPSFMSPVNTMQNQSDKAVTINVHFIVKGWCIICGLFPPALALLALYARGKVQTPADWLEAQIDGYTNYISRLERLVEVVPRSQIETCAREIYKDCAKIFGYQLGFVLDEAHLLSTYANQVVW